MNFKYEIIRSVTRQLQMHWHWLALNGSQTLLKKIIKCVPVSLFHWFHIISFKPSSIIPNSMYQKCFGREIFIVGYLLNVLRIVWWLASDSSVIFWPKISTQTLNSESEKNSFDVSKQFLAIKCLNQDFMANITKEVAAQVIWN